MFGRKQHRKADNVEPDLPITPMLDMSFQLLAFFVITFNPTAPEGHLDMALPKEEGGASAAPPSVDVTEEQEELTVTVEADQGGAISDIRVGGAASAEGKSVGPDSQELFKELKGRLKAGGKPAKVKLEMSDTLRYKLVIKLMDEIQRAGYKSVAPALHDPTKKK
jgi:biopolymer transport protein ExbD